MKKRNLKFFGLVFVSLLLWSCGHTQSSLSDGTLPPSTAVDTSAETGTDSGTAAPAPSESKPVKEFETLSQRLNVGDSYASPLSSDWQKTFSTQLSLTSTEIQD